MNNCNYTANLEQQATSADALPKLEKQQLGFRKLPNLILADWIRNEPQPEICIDGTRYVAPRPVSIGPWWRRWTLAWGVFIGKYDALKWIDQ